MKSYGSLNHVEEIESSCAVRMAEAGTINNFPAFFEPSSAFKARHISENGRVKLRDLSSIGPSRRTYCRGVHAVLHLRAKKSSVPLFLPKSCNNIRTEGLQKPSLSFRWAGSSSSSWSLRQLLVLLVLLLDFVAHLVDNLLHVFLHGVKHGVAEFTLGHGFPSVTALFLHGDDLLLEGLDELSLAAPASLVFKNAMKVHSLHLG